MNIIALTTLSHEHTCIMTYRNEIGKKNKREWDARKEIEKKKPVKRQPCSSSMICIYTYPCSWPREQGMNMLSWIVAFSCMCIHSIVFSPWKRKSLLSLPFTDRETFISASGCALQAGWLISLHALFSSLLRVADSYSCAVKRHFRIVSDDDHCVHYRLKKKSKDKAANVKMRNSIAASLPSWLHPTSSLSDRSTHGWTRFTMENFFFFKLVFVCIKKPF